MAAVQYVTRVIGVLVALQATSGAVPAYQVVWNAPSQVCEKCGGLPLDNYGIEANKNEAHIGGTIAYFNCSSFGLWPKLNATITEMPCWDAQPRSPCSWTPWGSIEVLQNGGVPQAANLTLHLEKVAADIQRQLPDREYAGIIILDVESWRPVLWANFNAMSFNVVFSERLIQKKHPGWNASQVSEVAAIHFNKAALAFFIETIRTIRALRPKAKIGYYGWPDLVTTEGTPTNVDDDLKDMYREIDVMAPSVYPLFDASRQANYTGEKILQVRRIQCNSMFL